MARSRLALRYDVTGTRLRKGSIFEHRYMNDPQTGVEVKISKIYRKGKKRYAALERYL